MVLNTSVRLNRRTGRPLVSDVPTGIVHIGLGAFHRAHQAVYTEDAVAHSGGDWGIAGVAPRSADVVDALNAQDRLFSVTAAEETRVVGVLSDVRRAAADPDAVVALIADPAVRIVTLTITEKGYRPGAPVPELLIRGLTARARADAGPIAVVSCDNLPANGRRLAELISGSLDAADQVSFPGTMVDRIVPASTAETIAVAERNLGVRDLAAVSAEPFKQWVIEDDFPGGRPDWAAAGAILTADARPWERLKLRTLNGVHSAIAYLGAVAGRPTVASALRMPGMRDVMGRFIAEDIAGSLTPPEGISVVAYGDSVLHRFADPGLAHTTIQVAKDGSQKLPQRVLDTITDIRAAGGVPRWAALVVAAWMRYVQRYADDGSALPVDDPLAAEIARRLAAAPSTPAGVVDALLGLTSVFPRELAADDVVRGLLVEWLTDLRTHGVEDTLAGMR